MGWENHDFNPRAGQAINFDMRNKDWPLEKGVYDTVYTNNVLHLFRGEYLFRVMWNIGEILKFGGFLLASVPYGPTGNPLHLQYWDETTPMHFVRSAYFNRELQTTLCDQMMPLHEWEVVEIELEPKAAWLGKSHNEINHAKTHYNNVLQSMRFVMQKVEC